MIIITFSVILTIMARCNLWIRLCKKICSLHYQSLIAPCSIAKPCNRAIDLPLAMFGQFVSGFSWKRWGRYLFRRLQLRCMTHVASSRCGWQGSRRSGTREEAGKPTGGRGWTAGEVSALEEKWISESCVGKCEDPNHPPHKLFIIAVKKKWHNFPEEKQQHIDNIHIFIVSETKCSVYGSNIIM